MKRAQVTAIDRTNQEVVCQLLGGSTVRASILGKCPWPLAFVWLEEVELGTYLCLGAAGHSERIVEEQFCRFGTAASPSVQFDTNWRWRESGATVFAGNSYAGLNGVVDMTTAAVSGNWSSLVKSSDTGAVSSAVWMHGRLRLPTPITSAVYVFGLGDNATSDFTFGTPAVGDDMAAIVYNSTVGLWQLVTISDATASTVNGSVTPTVSTTYYFDLVWVPGLFTAGWVDGDGYMISTTNIPARDMEPWVGVQTTSAAVRTIRMDSIHVEAISPDPTPI